MLTSFSNQSVSICYEYGELSSCVCVCVCVHLTFLLLHFRGFTGIPGFGPDEVVVSGLHEGFQLGEQGLLGRGASRS